VAAAVLGPFVPAEARRVEGIIDTSLGGEGLLEEPVASGGDSSLWTDDRKDDRDDEDRPR
jgi:hypothetical protein